MLLTLYSNGNSYLVFNHSHSKQFNQLKDYLLKLSITRESLALLYSKLTVSKKLINLFIKLGYKISLNRILFGINSKVANSIRSNYRIPIDINEDSITRSNTRYPDIQGCYFEENAHHKDTLKLNDNVMYITFELKVKCGLDDFINYPNLFTIRNILKHPNSRDLSHNPTKLFNDSALITEQLKLFSNEINRKYLKIYINNHQISNSEINSKTLELISETIKSSKGLINNILRLQAYSSGQQFIAHIIYLLLDIIYRDYGFVSDSWKIQYLQHFQGFTTSYFNEIDNHLSIQINNFKKGLFLIKSLLLILLNRGHSRLRFSLIFFLKKLNLLKLNGIPYNPLLKLRIFLEKYSKGYPNTSIQRLYSLKLLLKNKIIKESLEWLQHYFIGRTMMDCSLIFTLYDLDFNSPSDQHLMVKHLIVKNCKISLIDLDIKPYIRIGKWANDAYIALKDYKINCKLD